jgi:zinc protease
MLCRHAMAGAEPDLAQPIANDPALKLGQLPNGLTYYIQHNKKPEKRAELRLVLKVGSILEEDDQQGLAHFVEHMGFASTAHFQKHELISWLQSIGIQFGSDLAAFTSFDDTKYILPIPTDRPADVDKAFLVLQDWASGMLFKPEDIETERPVILEELRSHRSVDERLARAAFDKALQATKYPTRWPTGQVERIETVTAQQLQRFYRDWYRPDLMAVIVVGDIDPALVEKMIVRHFAHLKNPPGARSRDYLTPTYPAQSEAVVLTDPAASSSTVSIRYAILPEPDWRTLSDLRQGLMQELLTQMGSRRLALLTQQREPDILSGVAAFSPLMPGYHSYFASAAISKKGIQSAVDTLIQEKNRLRRFGFTADELAFAKSNLLARLQHAAAERKKTESVEFANRYSQHFLLHTPIPGAAQDLAYAQRLLPAITQEALNRFAETVLDTQTDKLIAYTGIQQVEELQPDPIQLLAFLRAAEKLPVSSPKEETGPGKLISAPATAGSIVSETTNPVLGTTELQLSNGLRVWLKPTPFQDDQIFFGAMRGGGTSLYNGLRILNARYATVAVGTMGLQNFSPAQLQQVMAGKSASLALSIAPTTEFILGGSSRTDLETLLQLLYLSFAPPRRDENLYNLFLSQLTAQVRTNSVQPEQLSAQTIGIALFQNNPWLDQIRSKNDIAILQLDDMLDIYQSRFGSAAGFTFVLVGNFDVARIKPVLASWLGSLPTQPISTEAGEIGLRPMRGVLRKTLRAGESSKSIVSLSFSGFSPKRGHDHIKQRLLIDLVNNRINEVLREKLGLIYTGAADGSIETTANNVFTLGIYLPCGPENIERVQAAMADEIRQLQTRGPTLDQLNKVKQYWLNSRKALLKDNSYWLTHLINQTDRPPEKQVALTDGVAIMDQITPETLQQAANDYMDLDNCLHVVVNPPQ